jgi:hypothetical protein
VPNYTFIDPKTEEEQTLMLTFAEYDEFVEKNPHLIQKLVPTPIVDPYHLGRQQAPSGFRDILKRIKKRNRGSNIDPGNLGSV